MIGATPPSVSELTRSSERLSYIYVEHATIHRADNAITVTEERGVTHIPAASLSALLLGPGTRVTHQAMVLLGECGTSAIWVGEQGVRYYAHGRSLARSSRLLIAQAEKVSNTRSRLEVARTMYAWRFPGEDTSQLTMQQLRGREGARVRRVYRYWSDKTGVPWSRRDYNPNDFGDSDPINQALSAGHACLYGIVHAAIVALGCAPGLGFVHTGHAWSFVYDIADLYKADTTIPLAFEIASEFGKEDDIGSITRKKARDIFEEKKLVKQIVEDLQYLLEVSDDEKLEGEFLGLWDNKLQLVSYGVSYTEV